MAPSRTVWGPNWAWPRLINPTLQQGNDLLPAFIRRFNHRFAIAPCQSEKAWRSVPKTLDVNRAISFLYPTKVGLDNTVRVGDLLLDIPSGPLGRSYAKTRVEVRHLLNGSWKVYYQDRLIAKHPSTALQELGNFITGSIKLPLNPFMTNHLDDKSMRRLREWVHQRLIGAAAFPL